MDNGLESPSSFGILNYMDCVSLRVIKSYFLQLPTSCPPNETDIEESRIQARMIENKRRGKMVVSLEPSG